MEVTGWDDGNHGRSGVVSWELSRDKECWAEGGEVGKLQAPDFADCLEDGRIARR